MEQYAGNPFDISDVSDLPENERPRKPGAKSKYLPILEKAPPTFTPTQFRIAARRILGPERKRGTYASALSSLKNSGYVEAKEKGLYSVTERV